MPLQDLDPAERTLVLDCLRAVVDGPFIADDGEFSVLMGLDRDAARGVIARWPVDDEADGDACIAINNAMNNLLGYPHGAEAQWPRYITASPEEISRIFCHWRGGPASSYFDGIM